MKNLNLLNRKWVSIAAAAVIVVGTALALILTGTFPGGKMNQINAEIPDEHYGGSVQSFVEGSDWGKWWQAKQPYWAESRQLQGELAEFNTETMRAVLESSEENVVYSPLNLYIALSMLAETASDETQTQILKLLRADETESLRERVKTLWNANFSDTRALQSQLANSLWLRSGTDYNQKLLKLLAEDYYADSFVGNMGTEEMDKALRDWTDAHTGGLLKEYTEGMATDPLTYMEIISTLYFKTMWQTPFDAGQNTTETFHGAAGDIECEMMHQSAPGMYFFGDNFSAADQSLGDGGKMVFVLPDDGSKIIDVLENDQLMEMLSGSRMLEYQNYKEVIINKTIPKFTLSSKLDLVETLKTLGVTEAFDAKNAQFKQNILANPASMADNIYLSKVDHAAMVSIDEEGVTGAAYTDLALVGAGMPPTDEVDFVLDRPFLYFILGNDGSILFAGTAQDIR